MHRLVAAQLVIDFAQKGFIGFGRLRQVLGSG
jgi:hypothetical protein